jgi:hypothetical protein
MTVHTPAIAPHQGVHVSTTLLQAVVIGAILVAAVGVGFLAVRPVAVTGPTYPDVSSSWRLEYRHGEIDEGRTGPHSDVLQYRAGEINAATQ